MTCKLFGGLLAALALTFTVGAAETSGKFVGYDTAKKELTVDVNGTKSKFILTDDVRVMTARGEATKKGISCFSNPKVAKPGAPLTVVTGEKDVVTEIKLGGKAK